jgi:hypothetical protein
LIIEAISFVAFDRPFSEFPHFIGHNGESTSLFACACCFDSGVQCKKIGLVRDIVDHTDDLADLVARFTECLHGVGGFVHDLGDLFHSIDRLTDDISTFHGCILLLSLLWLRYHRRCVNSP